MSATTPEQKAARLYLAGQILAGNALELPESLDQAARYLGKPLSEWEYGKDWNRVCAKMALTMADAVLTEADTTLSLTELKHPTMDPASAEELRRITQQANALWRRHGRIKAAELSDIARFLAHWSRTVHVELYGRNGGANER